MSMAELGEKSKHAANAGMLRLFALSLVCVVVAVAQAAAKEGDVWQAEPIFCGCSHHGKLK